MTRTKQLARKQAPTTTPGAAKRAKLASMIADPEPARNAPKQPRWSSARVANREIRAMQDYKKLRLTRRPFVSLVRRVVREVQTGSEDMRLSAPFLLGLQEVTERHLIDLFARGDFVRRQAGSHICYKGVGSRRAPVLDAKGQPVRADAVKRIAARHLDDWEDARFSAVAPVFTPLGH